jgi:hypothetical protein
LWGLIAGGVMAPVGWFGTDLLEQDNDFCNACHLEPGVPLHIDIRRDFDGRPAATLAGLHGGASHPTRAGDASVFRCIDCHGGVGLMGKARTKVLAAKDGFWWLVGHFEEPTEMAWPLLDEDCRQCHVDFSEAEARSLDPNPPFHALSVHNVALGMSCVECHLSHEPGGLEDLYYLQPAQVRGRCGECHSDFE